MSRPQMTLGALLLKLSDLISLYGHTTLVVGGFTRPHSYRGYYACLAFEYQDTCSLGRLYDEALSARGATYRGYKGGDYVMTDETPVYIAENGYTGSVLRDISVPHGVYTTEE